MDAIMELDEFKSAWQALDRRLELDNRLRLHDLRERTLHKTRGNLRPRDPRRRPPRPRRRVLSRRPRGQRRV